ncbi:MULTISPECIES: hypothetical protein [unclassified Nocardioides]|uniref:hypothetical protein n=1 Tax=unclassified Nocardioides TaxID=2615069 RepID=UPI0024073A06|nr:MULTISPECIES: hypothetical protein [unclassified Nocardioides]
MAPSDHVSDGSDPAGDARPGLALVTGRSDAVRTSAEELRARRPGAVVHPVQADLAP